MAFGRSLALLVCLGMAGTTCHLISGVGDLSFVDPGAAGHTATSTKGGAGHGASAGAAGGAGFAGSNVGGGGDAGSSAGGGGLASGGAPCFPPELVDDFEDGSIDTTIWNDSYHSGPIYGEANGTFYVAPAEWTSTTQYAEIYSAVPVDLTGCAVWVEVPSVLGVATQGETFLELWGGDEGNVARLRVSHGMLHVFVADSGATALDAEVTTYDATAHRWWRVRESSGTLFLETSPDGYAWAVHGTVPTPWYVTSIYVGLQASAFYTEAGPERVEFDNMDRLP